MIKNYICIRDCEYIHGNDNGHNTKTKFTAGMAYMINATYILSDKDQLHQVHKNSKVLIYGYATTKFIYRNFVLEDDYFCINSMFSLLLGINTILSKEEAKIMRDSLFKRSSPKKS